MMLAATPLRQASGEWMIQTSSYRRRQWEKEVNHVHKRCCLQGKVEWSMPGTAGTELASHVGLPTEGCPGQGSVRMESCLS